MYTFHLEAVVEDASNAKHPDENMVKVLKQVKASGMYAGVALKPKTPIETLFPYIEDKLVDQVGRTDLVLLYTGRCLWSCLSTLLCDVAHSATCWSTREDTLADPSS